MEEGRMMKINHVLATHRKNTSNLNYLVRERYKTERRGFIKQQTMLHLRHNLHTRPVKQSLVELRGMQKVLKRKRHPADRRNCNNSFGRYGGVTLDDLKPEVTGLIRENHPRERRLRKVERMLNEGFESGRLLEEEKAKQKFERIMALPSPVPVPVRSHTCAFGQFHDGTKGNMFLESNRLVLPPIGITRHTSEAAAERYTCNQRGRLPRGVTVIPTAENSLES